MNFDNELLYM